MYRMVPRFLGAAVLVAALGLTGACGLIGGDDKEACDAIKKELTDVGNQATSQTSNPTAIVKLYRDAAGNIRSEGDKAGGDVQTAANEVAEQMEKLATALEQVASGSSTSIPDTTGLTSAGAKLDKACN